MSLLLDWIFPRRCYLCGRPGSYFCPTCVSTLKFRSVKPPRDRLDGVLSLFRYHRGIKSAIKDLKFSFVTSIVPEISPVIVTGVKQNYPSLLKYWQENHFTLVPIPLHPYRHNWRGFNQSSLLAKSLASGLSLDYSEDLISRVRYTSPQSKLSRRSLRHQNTFHPFIYNSEFTLSIKNIILFDDVFTTGSTLASAADVFPQNYKIWGLTVAG